MPRCAASHEGGLPGSGGIERGEDRGGRGGRFLLQQRIAVRFGILAECSELLEQKDRYPRRAGNERLAGRRAMGTASDRVAREAGRS